MLHADIFIGSPCSFPYATAAGSATSQEESFDSGSPVGPRLIWDSSAAETQEVTP